MTGILLDTSAYSGFTRGDIAILESDRAADRVVFNAIVLGELRAGFLYGNQQRHNEAALVGFLKSPRVEVALVDEETSHFFATIYVTLRKSGQQIPMNDLWIAATAMQHGLRLVTKDEHFRRIPHILVDCYPS